MKKLFLISFYFFSYINSYSQNWDSIKNITSPVIALTSEYDSIYRQPLSGMGWEDGVHISDDGLHLYCTYVPIDLLSFSLNGDLPNNFSSNYLRGASDFGMDLISNPISASEWLHSDILYSSRDSAKDTFTSWQLSAMARSFYSEGAPSPLFAEDGTVGMMFFTSNDNETNNSDIWVIKNTEANPSGTGEALPSPINTTYNEDNPNVTKLTTDTLVMFYDSDNLPGGSGDIDLWYTVSYDGGANWSKSGNVTTINTTSKEHQPFLFYDTQKGKYFLYYSAYNADGKLAIYRSEQLTQNDWDSWANPELVISAGNSAGIGEPTLTADGDLSFVVVYEDPLQSSAYNRFDADPWYAIKSKSFASLSGNTLESRIKIYPNPSKEKITIDYSNKFNQIQIFNIMGLLVYSGNSSSTIDLSNFSNGIYVISILTESGQSINKKVIKE